jgi:hypothetical protein
VKDTNYEARHAIFSSLPLLSLLGQTILLSTLFSDFIFITRFKIFFDSLDVIIATVRVSHIVHRIHPSTTIYKVGCQVKYLVPVADGINCLYTPLFCGFPQSCKANR